jgi:hypothetical protein
MRNEKREKMEKSIGWVIVNLSMFWNWKTERASRVGGVFDNMATTYYLMALAVHSFGNECIRFG